MSTGVWFFCSTKSKDIPISKSLKCSASMKAHQEQYLSEQSESLKSYGRKRCNDYDRTGKNVVVELRCKHFLILWIWQRIKRSEKNFAPSLSTPRSSISGISFVDNYEFHLQQLFHHALQGSQLLRRERDHLPRKFLPYSFFVTHPQPRFLCVRFSDQE